MKYWLSMIKNKILMMKIIYNQKNWFNNLMNTKLFKNKKNQEKNKSKIGNW